MPRVDAKTKPGLDSCCRMYATGPIHGLPRALRRCMQCCSRWIRAAAAKVACRSRIDIDSWHRQRVCRTAANCNSAITYPPHPTCMHRGGSRACVVGCEVRLSMPPPSMCVIAPNSLRSDDRRCAATATATAIATAATAATTNTTTTTTTPGVLRAQARKGRVFVATVADWRLAAAIPPRGILPRE